MRAISRSGGAPNRLRYSRLDSSLALRLERCSRGLIRWAPSDHSLVSVCSNASTSIAVSSHPCSTRAASVSCGRRVNWTRNSSSVMRRPTTRSTVRCDIGGPVRHCSRRSCARDVPACVRPGRPHLSPHARRWMPRPVQEGGYGYTGCMCLCRRIQAELSEAGVQLNARDSQTSRCLRLVSTRLAHDPLDRLALEQMQIGRLG